MEDSKIIALYNERDETDVKYGAYCLTIAENILHNQEYAKTYVPAVEVVGLDEYFENQASKHTSS